MLNGMGLMEFSSSSTSLKMHSVRPKMETMPVFDSADIGFPIKLDAVVDDWNVEAVLTLRLSVGRRADSIQKYVSMAVKLGDGRHGPEATTSTVNTKRISEDT